MKRRAIGLVVYSAIGVISSTGVTFADMVGRYECSVVGPSVPEPVGDRPDHTIQSIQYSCVGVDGLLKGATLSGNAVVEWQGPKSTFLAASTTHRTPGGLAVGQLLEGSGLIVVKDGKPLGQDASGKAMIKFASGTLAELAGRTLKWISKPVSFNRFEQEYFSE
ncbi:hypothetical protein HU230_0024000 [Bradyrhizobium quebecense]|uniref:Uncharacterized protein n=1 Tax=Bradyrhizobium quebecense TaxID=2748629 RepID=A0A973WIQ5_9BRAD|nr:hypothetical protein [Bradyrhizobium quebecense]UGA41445.1 hypothetical protein HU230_0024000 [Bradyrhizobium quebecense]